MGCGNAKEAEKSPQPVPVNKPAPAAPAAKPAEPAKPAAPAKPAEAKKPAPAAPAKEEPKPAEPKKEAPPAKAEEAPAAPAAPVVEEEPDENWDDADTACDAELDLEINGKKINKAGEEVDRFDRAESRPEDNLGMFSFEAAGSGDQALAVKPWVGQIAPPDNDTGFENGTPDIDLELEYIYGYRCFDTRQNVFLRTASEIVYMAAAVGIVLDTQANTQKFMGAGDDKTAKGHSDDISALAIHPNRKTVATGEVGKNPKIIVWNSDDMSIIKDFRQGRNSRAVTTLGFNSSGDLLASAALDNDHTVRVWKWESGSQIWELKGGPDKILDCCWSPVDNTLCTAGIKHIYFWVDADTAGCDKKRGIFGSSHNMCSLTTAQYLDDGRAVTGGTNGQIYVWGKDRKCEKSFKAHGSSAIHTMRIIDGTILSGGADHKLNEIDGASFETMNSIGLDSTPRSVDKLGETIIVGCRDGNIIEVTGQNKKVVMESHSDGEVWGLQPHPTQLDAFVTTGDDNKIKVWDKAQRKCLSTGVLDPKAGAERKAGYGASTLASTTPNQQARSVTISKASGAVALGYNTGRVAVRQGIDDINNTIADTSEPKEWIETMRFSPCGTKLAVGSHDQYIYIYDASGSYGLESKAQKHSSSILALDWSKDSTVLHSCCAAYELLYWTVEGGLTQNPSGVSEYKNEEWATFSTHFGWPVQGIFGGVIDYTHVNRVDRSPDKKHFAVGNDWGLVEIFGNPNGEGAKSKGFRGHSEHVTNVKWSADGSYLFSAGGYDQCIMQWKNKAGATFDPTKPPTPLPEPPKEEEPAPVEEAPAEEAPAEEAPAEEAPAEEAPVEEAPAEEAPAEEAPAEEAPAEEAPAEE